MIIDFQIPFEGKPKGRPRFTKSGRVYTPEDTLLFERAVRIYCQKIFPAPLQGPIFVRLVFVLKKPKRPKNALPVVKPDLDNLAKAILDGLNQVAWVDDSQIVKLHLEKVYGEKPFISVQMLKVEPAETLA